MTNSARRKGTGYERRVVDHAAGRGLPWDRAPLRGKNDLLDVQGCLPDGWLIGAKALSDATLADRLSTSMNEARAALARLAAQRPELADSGVMTAQVVQRRGKPIGQSYVVMEYDQFLDIVLLRRAWNGPGAWDENRNGS